MEARPGCARMRRCRQAERKSQGLTLAQPAERMGMHAPALSRLEAVKNAEPHARDTAQMVGSAGAEIGR
jgi:transcriptional regulator with XRE-family HTH domain